MLETKNSARGRVAKAAGDAFESWIEIQHEKARHLGILAHIAHNEAHSKVIRGRLIYTECGVADYTGTLDTTGRSLAVEAKSTSDKRLYKTAVSPKQQEHLNAVARAGGLSLLLVEFRTPQGRARYAIPWLKAPWEIVSSAESIRASILEVFAIEPLAQDACYLSRFHVGGVPSTPVRRRTYARD